jgi:hypothetical protein
MAGKIILTTCSLNHMAQAKSLGDSVLQHAPGYKLVIGLVDKLEGRIPADYYAPHQLIEAHELNIPFFDEMCKRYNVLELNCALKSFFTAYVLEQFAPDSFIFLDSDMLLFDSLQVVEEELAGTSILLTPHIQSPFPADNKNPKEKDILKTGMFNAGFYALNNDPTAKAFIDWWKERMKDQCYERPKEGLNVDQKWLNFVPFYFPHVKTLRHPGCNTAYWNLHERNLQKKGEQFFCNEQPLVFYHFSGYSLQHPDKISRHQSRFIMDTDPAVKDLFSHYRDLLIKNRHEEMLQLACYYKKEKGLLQKLGLMK